jgi:hypothetical protein
VANPVDVIDGYNGELYKIADDFSESVDLTKERLRKYREGQVKAALSR